MTPARTLPAALTHHAVDPERLRRAADAVLPPARRRAAQRRISAWDGFAPTPMHDLRGLAAALGVARVWCKDEGGRFGLGSFKALGGAHAVFEQVQARPVGLTVACATEGNHGRSVAWAAQRFGCRCVVYLHERVSERRERAIAAYGARIRRVPGTYDDAVRACARDAAAEGWTVVSDTSWPGYDEIPRSVMAGYTVMTREIARRLGAGERPTHVFLQGGVGGLAAAVLADLGDDVSPAATRYVLVEPQSAACLMASLRSGRPSRVEGPLETVMAGLACGEPSALALEVIREGVSAALAIGDALAVDAARALARGAGGDPRIVAGASGAAGLAGLMAVLETASLREALGLDAQSRVLLINTERDTDPDAYRRLVLGEPALETAPAGGLRY